MAVDTDNAEKISAAFWRCVIVFEGYPFSTSGRGSRSGVEYTYQVTRRGSSGGRHYEGESVQGYGNELWVVIDGEKKEKSISRSTVELGFQKYLVIRRTERPIRA